MTTNTTRKSIVMNSLMSAVSLFIYGFGLHLTMLADIGVNPWDVLQIGLANTFGVLYGTVSIIIGLMIVIIDLALREPLGISTLLDVFIVGKSVDFFNYLHLVPEPKSLVGSICIMLIGFVIMGYMQYFYMRAALSCGPRDTLLIALKRRITTIPIGIVSVLLLGIVTILGYFFGGPVGIGTLLSVCFIGPIMQFAFRTMHFDATQVHHQNLKDSWIVLFR